MTVRLLFPNAHTKESIQVAKHLSNHQIDPFPHAATHPLLTWLIVELLGFLVQLLECSCYA